MVDSRYLAFCAADPLFYDKPGRRGGTEDDFAVPLANTPGWSSRRSGVWRSWRPSGTELPGQGWKIHVSATVDNAGHILDVVQRYCGGRRIAFKHLAAPRLLRISNAKYAPRAASGKFITIYPACDSEFETALGDLDDGLGGEHGPYILSDLRYRDGPLYVRYGAFTERWLHKDGERVPAMLGPDGTLVEDRREPGFRPPDWVPRPACLAGSIAARTGAGPGELPYAVDRPLHYSNGGGVYLAHRRTDGTQVVLKEARPHAAWDASGHDAIQRLRREQEVLELLAGIEGIPAVHESFDCWEHRFLAMEYRPGVPLTKWLATRYPLARPGADDAEVLAYRDDALRVAGRITELVAEVNARGVMIADLHPANILVDGDTVSLIDFEIARSSNGAGPAELGAPGFRAPGHYPGANVDDYALAAVRLWLFLPLVSVLELNGYQAQPWLRFAKQRFGLTEEFCRAVAAQLVPPGRRVATAPSTVPGRARRPAADQLRSQIVAAIVDSATPGRTDRLFPGDIRQFDTGLAASFAHGAAGVLHALDATEGLRIPEFEQWLLDTVERDAPARPGFYHGCHGTAWVLGRLGHLDEADALLAGAGRSTDEVLGHGLADGLAGIGLALAQLDLVNPAAGHGEHVPVVARRLATWLDSGDRPATPGGLLHGWSGAALLFVRLFEQSKDEYWLSAAERAVLADLDTCVHVGQDIPQVRDEYDRTVPYLGTGVAGIAIGAYQVARHRPDGAAARALPRLLRGCDVEFVAHPGLISGRAGLLMAAAHAADAGEEAEGIVARHTEHLAWHAVDVEKGTAFPGNQLLRLSMDVDTGNAGILLALHAATPHPGERAHPLPFFEP